MAAQSDALTATVAELGFDAPTYIVNTHAHPGNVGGNGAFSVSPKIIAYRGVGKQMGGDSHVLLDLPADAMPDLEIEDDMTLRFNGERVQIIALPGSHTPHDLIVHFPDSGVACLGDIYPGRFFTTAVYGGKMENLPAKLRKIIEILPEDTKLLYGHQAGVGSLDDLREMLTIWDEMIPQLKEGIAAGKERPELIELLPEKWADVSIPGGGFISWVFCLQRDLQDTGEPQPERASIMRPMFDAQRTGNGDSAVAALKEAIDDGLTIVPEHERDLLQFSYWLQRTQERTEDALAVFKFGIELFPEAWNTHDSLAEAYAIVGEKDLAIAHYNKSLELNPDNANATTELAKLGDE
jgi:glyoxylase-like metal-dependent hydrolase (beta-lactamase superfamily II)